MSIYYGVTISEKLFYEAIAYKKCGKRDLKLLAESIDISDIPLHERRTLEEHYNRERYFDFLSYYNMNNTNLQDYVCGTGELIVISLDCNLQLFFIGDFKVIPGKLLTPNELSALFSETQIAIIDKRLRNFGLENIPASITIGVAKYQSDLKPPTEYVTEKDKI
jgi:hypothetical protein